MSELQDAKDMLKRWSDAECQCDPSVGFLCELCCDSQVLNNLIKQHECHDLLQQKYDRLKKLATEVTKNHYDTEQGCPKSQAADWFFLAEELGLMEDDDE